MSLFLISTGNSVFPLLGSNLVSKTFDCGPLNSQSSEPFMALNLPPQIAMCHKELKRNVQKNELHRENVKQGGLKDFLFWWWLTMRMDCLLIFILIHHPWKILHNRPSLTFSLRRWSRVWAPPAFLLPHRSHLLFGKPPGLSVPATLSTWRRCCCPWEAAWARRSTGARCAARCPSSRATWSGTCLFTPASATSAVATAVARATRIVGTWRSTKLNVATIPWFAEEGTSVHLSRQKKRKQIFKLEQYSFKISVFVCARLYIVCTVSIGTMHCNVSKKRIINVCERNHFVLIQRSLQRQYPSLYICSPYDALISTFLLFHSPRRLHQWFVGSSNFFKKVAFRSILLKTRDLAMSKKLTASPSHFWTTQIGA